MVIGRNSVSFSESSLEVLVDVVEAGGVLELGLLLGDRVVLALEQLLGGVAPGAEVVLVEDDEVPVDHVEPLVLGLDVAGAVAAEQVLEGAEVDDGLLRVDLRRVAAGRAREVLPAVEVDVGFEVGLPRILDGGLEGHDEHALGAELLGELVGGEGLAEAHLRVPQEARDGVHVLLPDRVEVGVRLVHGLGLLAAHRERLVMGAGEPQARPQLGRSPSCTSSGVQRIHSRDAPMTTFSKPFSIEALRARRCRGRSCRRRARRARRRASV